MYFNFHFHVIESEEPLRHQASSPRSDTESVTSASGEFGDDFVISVDDEIHHGAENSLGKIEIM